MSSPHALRFILALLLASAVQGQMPPGGTGRVLGTVFATEGGQERTFVPGARVRS